MNARGLMELIVIKVGLDIGVIGQEMFTMLMVMAIVTTVMTSPLATAVRARNTWARSKRDSREVRSTRGNNRRATAGQHVGAVPDFE